MPNMADIVVKKADGSTNITWTKLVQSAGDGVWALWRSVSVAGITTQQPQLKVGSKANGTDTARRVNFQLTYPVTRATAVAGVNEIVGYNRFDGTWTLLNESDAVTTAEFSEQTANLIASSLLKSVTATGFAPT